MTGHLLRRRFSAVPSWLAPGEWWAAFGDFGTLVPFLLAFIVVAGMPAANVLMTFGLALIGTAVLYRTPFPVQPMKAIGSVAAAQAAMGLSLGPEAFQLAAILTGLFWLVVAFTRLPDRLSTAIPRTVMFGIVLGLGMALMLDAARMMSANWLVAAPCLFGSFVLLSKRRFPVMALLLVVGVSAGLLQRPDAAMLPLGEHGLSLRWPTVQLPALEPSLLGVVAVVLVAPQLPLTFGNAVLAIVEENNRLFPERSVTRARVAATTGVMNVVSGFLGGIPMCHGAGGMAGYVRFGARTGGAPLLLGLLLVLAALFAATAVTALFALFAQPVLGVILFVAGSQLALGACGGWGTKGERFVLVVTAALALWNAGAALVGGLAFHYLLQRRLVEL